jgi:protein FRA10AC1
MSGKPRNIISEADKAVLEQNYEFVPEEKKTTSWQDRMVERYHAGLYKEFALADLSRPGKLGLRWRTRQEVVQGRGERSCGNKSCQFSANLITLEVPFSYNEGGITKNELVKLRLCPSCKPMVKTKSTSNEKSRKSQSKKKSRETVRDSDTEVDSDSNSSKFGPSKKRRSRYDGESSNSSTSSDDDYRSRKKKKHRCSDDARKRRKKHKKSKKRAHRKNH